MQSEFAIDRCLDSIPSAGRSCAPTLILPESVKPPGVKTLSAWFRCLNDLQNLDVSPYKIFSDAARAISVPGGLDGAVIVTRSRTQTVSGKGAWHIVASDPEPTDDIDSLRWDLLQQVEDSSSTIFHSSDRITGTVPATAADSETTFVVAPILDESNEVDGFIYAWRKPNRFNKRHGIRELEAHFVTLVAQTLSSILMRIRKQEELSQKKALLDRTFPAHITERLRYEPAVLDGQQKNVTSLFIDIRGFSSLTNRIEPKISYELVMDIMDLWTEIVMEHSGTVVDYFGDGLMAFWNAPIDIENHASLATRCALALQASLSEINHNWKSIIDQELKAGVGIATGLAHVGNCGSRHRIKYGPHGPKVNLASRLEKLTKRLNCPLLINDQAAGEIDADYLVRRICKARIAGFDNAIDVYCPVDPDSVDQIGLIYDYEQALDNFEHGRLALAKESVDKLIESFPNDSVSKMLRSSIRAATRPDRRQTKTVFLQAAEANLE